jgi:hypothetical protein
VADDFIISGTGQVIRPGERIWARQTGWMTYDPGVLIEVLNTETVLVRYDCDPTEPQVCMAKRVMREDDRERVAGQPLWCWC